MEELKHIVELLDVALSSDNPAVKEQLQKLLMTAALCNNPEPGKKVTGVLSDLFSRVEDLSRRVERVERDASYSNQYEKSSWDPYAKVTAMQQRERDEIDRIKSKLVSSVTNKSYYNEKPLTASALTKEYMDELSKSVFKKGYK